MSDQDWRSPIIATLEQAVASLKKRLVAVEAERDAARAEVTALESRLVAVDRAHETPGLDWAMAEQFEGELMAARAQVAGLESQLHARDEIIIASLANLDACPSGDHCNDVTRVHDRLRAAVDNPDAQTQVIVERALAERAGE